MHRQSTHLSPPTSSASSPPSAAGPSSSTAPRSSRAARATACKSRMAPVSALTWGQGEEGGVVGCGLRTVDLAEDRARKGERGGIWLWEAPERRLTWVMMKSSPGGRERKMKGA